MNPISCSLYSNRPVEHLCTTQIATVAERRLVACIVYSAKSFIWCLVMVLKPEDSQKCARAFNSARVLWDQNSCFLIARDSLCQGDSRSVAFVFLLVYIYGLYLTQSVHLHRLETGSEDQAAAVKSITTQEGRNNIIWYCISFSIRQQSKKITDILDI